MLPLYVAQKRRENEQVLLKKAAKVSNLGFSKIPWSVMSDSRLNDKHRKVYWIMAKATYGKGKRCCIGEHLIAEKTGLSRPTVNRKIAQLIAFGHVIVSDHTVGKRTIYEMVDPSFELAPKAQPSIKSNTKAATARKSSTFAAAAAFARNRDTDLKEWLA